MLPPSQTSQLPQFFHLSRLEWEKTDILLFKNQTYLGLQCLRLESQFSQRNWQSNLFLTLEAILSFHSNPPNLHRKCDIIGTGIPVRLKRKLENQFDEISLCCTSARFSTFLSVENQPRWVEGLLRKCLLAENPKHTLEIARQVIFQCIFLRKFANKYFSPENTFFRLFSFLVPIQKRDWSF